MINFLLRGGKNVLVHNIKGTSDRKPQGKYDSWLDFWEKKKGTRSGLCSCKDCCRIAEVGGHVQQHGSETDYYWYIVPLCKKCNSAQNTEPFSVNVSDLVRITKED